MGLTVLVAGLAVFLGSHIFVRFRDARDGIIARIGHNGYRFLFSVVSLAGLVLIVWGYGEYRAHEWTDIWWPPGFMRHITVGLMLLAAIFLTAVFVPSHIKAWLKYPMLASIKTWAFAHLLSNGDLGSIVMFGSFLAWAVYARIAAKRREDRGVTTPPSSWGNDVLVVGIGLVVFLAFGYAFHPIVIGVPVFGI